MESRPAGDYLRQLGARVPFIPALSAPDLCHTEGQHFRPVFFKIDASGMSANTPAKPEQLPLPGYDREQWLVQVRELEKEGIYTAERLQERRPQTYQAIIDLSAEGQGRVGVLFISRLLGVSPHMVYAVRQREGIAIDNARARLGNLAIAGAEMCVEAIIERLPTLPTDTPVDRLAVIAGILGQRGQELLGGIRHVIEVRTTDPSHIAARAYLAGLRDAGGSMGLGGEKDGQRGAAEGGEDRGEPGTIEAEFEERT